MTVVKRQQSDTGLCEFCGGSGQGRHTAYIMLTQCVRCEGAGVEPSEPTLHPGVLLRNRRSQKVWAIYGSYQGNQATPPTTGKAWGIHRMIPDRVQGGHYVWQIRVPPESILFANWSTVGYGDAWDHALMESDPLREKAGKAA